MPSYNVQPSYLNVQPVGYAGMPASMFKEDADSRIVETAAGIGFGLAVSQGTNDNGVILGGTAAGFRGITYRDVTMPPANSDKYVQYDLAGVMVRGDIWVSPFEAVVTTDPVYFVGATGRFGKTASGNQLIAGARWITSGAQDGLAILRLVRAI